MEVRPFRWATSGSDRCGASRAAVWRGGDRGRLPRRVRARHRRPDRERSATSTRRKKRSRTRSRSRRNGGQRTACRRVPRAGSSPLPGTGPSTGCAARRRATDRHIQAAALQALHQRDDDSTYGAEEQPVHDDRLRLIFTCCHPALALEAQVALTLRLLGGLTTAEIATRVPGARGDDGPAARARQAEDPRRAHSVSRPRRGRPARTSAGRARRCLPHLQRGLHRQLGRPPHAHGACARRLFAWDVCCPS